MPTSNVSIDLRLDHALIRTSDSSLEGWSSIIGIVTAIIGNVLISFALNTQRYAHVRLEQEYNEKRGTLSPDREHSRAGKNYGTTAQESIAEERSDLNAEAPGPGQAVNRSLGNGSDSDGSPRQMHDSFESGDTLRAEKQDDDDDGRKSYLKSKIWWLGIIMMTVGETGNFLAYGFAPASIVSPLGVVALICNCLIAPLVLKERFRQRDFWGVLVAVAGAVVVVLSANQSETKLGPDELWNDYIKRWEFLVYVIATAVAIVVLMFASPRYGRRTILVDLGLVGLFGGYTALSTKSVASLLSTSLLDAFTFPIFYVSVLILIASAVMQIRYLNKALQNFDATQVIPTQFVMFTLSVIIGSAVLYRDFESTTADHIVKFIAGCLLTFFGVWLITSNRQSGDDDGKEDYEDEDESIHLIDDEANEVSERTPLTLQTTHESLKPRPVANAALPKTPPESAAVPTIAVTPSEESILNRNPWLPQTMDFADSPASGRPQTPMNRSHSEMLTPRSGGGTPWYTPSTSRRPFNRSPSSPAGPETPTKSGRTRSPPRPDAAAQLAAAAALAPTPRRLGSIQRLMPGPLLAPLSSSLSGIVADSLLRGEGSPTAVRARLRRARSSRQTANRRRSSVQPDDEEANVENQLARRQTYDASLAPPATASEDDIARALVEDPQSRQPMSRLRSMSATLGSMIGKTSRRGKEREDEGGGSPQ